MTLTGVRAPRPVGYDGVDARRRVELRSLERFALGWPWHEPRHAAGLACELIRWVIPPVTWTTGSSPKAPVDGDPYRDAGTQQVCVDLPEVAEARFAITDALSYITAYAQNVPIVVPADWGTVDDHPMTRLYWYAPELGRRAVGLCHAAAEAIRAEVVASSRRKVGNIESFTTPNRDIVTLTLQWRATGIVTEDAVEFLRKFATGNPVVGAIDGAGGGILNRISSTLANIAGQPTEEITGRMFHWRVRDAFKGKTLSSELEANLRPAFEAAWAAAEYEFAYSLLEDLDQLEAT